jgi:hypothetical protein
VASNAASVSGPAKGFPEAVLIQVLTEDAVQGQASTAAPALAPEASRDGIDAVFADIDPGTGPGLSIVSIASTRKTIAK